MARKDYGDNLNGAIINQIVFERTPTGNRKTVLLTCDWDSRNSNTPDIGDIEEDMLLVSASQEQAQGGLCKITLIYENSVSALADVPSTTYDEDTSYIELSIQQHESFSGWSADWDEEKGEFKPSSDKYGITSFIVGSTVVTKTEYSTSQPSSRYNDVGTLEAPGGGYAGSNNWLIIGCSRRKISDGLYARETKYLYSAKAFNTDLYS